MRRLRLPEGRREQLLGDGANLFLRLRPQSRDWLFVWKDQGKKHKLMLGSASNLSLAEAREKAREARTHLADGKHPRVEREKRRVEQIALDRALGEQPQTVDALFEVWFQKEVEAQYADDGKEVRRRYEKDVAPIIGQHPPYSVVDSDIVKVLDLEVDGALVQRHVAPTLSTNDAELELHAVLAGQVIGQIANLSAAAHIRDGRLVPLLLQHVSDRVGVHVYYGSRAAQPRRVRTFIDLAIQRLLDSPTYVLSVKELASASGRWRKGRRVR